MPWDISDAERKDDRLARAVAEMQGPMAKAAEIVTKAVDNNFATESAAGDPWPPLAERTVKQRIAQGYGGEHPILQRSKDLRGSMKQRSDNESAEVFPSEDIEYAAVQANGSEDGKIPARDFLCITVSDEQNIENEILDHLIANEG
jgi:phage gpG-like protein